MLNINIVHAQPARSQLRSPMKRKFLSSFDSRVTLVTGLALGATVLHHVTRFLGFCALTWATVVLLGGFVSQLKQKDFYLVTVLLLLEAFRFAAAIFFSNLVLKKLVILSANPINLQYNDWQKKVVVLSIKLVAQALQLLVVSPSIVLPVLALDSVDYTKGDAPFNSLEASLRIFYILVVTNASIAALTVVYSLGITVILAVISKDTSLQRYFDEVIWRGFDNGLLQANEIDILEFAFKIQREEYSRNVQPVVVKKMYRDLLAYLLEHKKGLETTRVCLDSDDCYMQEAAANLVGLLVDLDTEGKLGQHKKLLRKLAQKVDNDQIGWAATNSLHMLACHYPEMILLLRNEDNDRLVNVLIEHISVEAPGRSIVYIRTLITLLEGTTSSSAYDKIEADQLELLKDKLRGIIKKSESKVRAKVLAGICLHALTSYDPQELNGMILGTAVIGKQYILQEEWEKVKILVDVKGKPSRWEKLEIRDPHCPEKPSKSLVHMLALCSLGVLAMLLLIAAVIFSLLHYRRKL